MSRVLVPGPVVGAFYAHHHIGPGVGHRGGDLGLDVLHRLFRRGIVHPFGCNINESQYTHLGDVDDVFLEIAEIAPAAGAGVHRRGHARAEHVFLGVGGAQRVLVGVGKHGEHMAVHIDEARRYHTSGHIHLGVGFAYKASGPCGNASVPDGHILPG